MHEITEKNGSASQAPAGTMRDTLLEVAADLFAERGYSATSVRAVVEAAGCKKPTLYYYFNNKESLFLEVLNNRTQKVDQVLQQALVGDGSVRERFTAGLHAYLAMVREDPTTLKLMMTAERHPEEGQPFFDFDALRQEHINEIRAILEAGVASGELREGFDFDEAVLALFGMIDHRFTLLLFGRPIPDDYPERLLDIFFHGVGR